MKQINLRFEEELHEQLVFIARAEKRTLHNLIMSILWKYVENFKKAKIA